MKPEFQQFIDRLATSSEELHQELRTNERTRHRYNGTKIWYSDFFDKPEILFVGINPGNGNPTNGPDKFDVIPRKTFVYTELWHGNTNFDLARETVQAFKNAGFDREVLEPFFNQHCMKTNFHHVITAKEGELRPLLTKLKYGRSAKYSRECGRWMQELVNLIQPKVIICEGKGTYNKMKSTFRLTDQVWNNQCGTAKIEGTDITLIAYQRNYSKIRNKVELGELLRNHVQIPVV